MPGLWTSLVNLARSEIPRDPVDEHDAEPAVATPDAVKRALSVVGQGVYRLGRGGRKPLASTPFDAEGRCDCSGYVSWAMGLDRYQPGRIGGDWISTDSIVRDAEGPRAMFELVAAPTPRVPSVAHVSAGDLVVYPGRHVGGVRVAIGHVGVIAVVGPTIAECRVAHCAASRHAGPGAVRVSDGRPWAKRGIVVRRI